MDHHYIHFSDRDFANDSYFWSWATGTDTTSDDFWQAFMQQYPHKVPAILKAKQQVIRLNELSYHLAQPQVDAIWQDIRAQNTELTDVDKKSAKTVISPLYRRKNILRWAASISVIVMLLSVYLIWQSQLPETRTVATTYGETLHVWLPDSSEVVLNANTSITYQEDWQHHDREVWIDGEAFFAVQHLKSNRDFIVHTDAVQVQVLGTEFTVNNRRDQTSVMLQKGKVKLKIEEREKDTQQLEMEPGDLVEYTPASTAIVQKVVNPEEYTYWTRNELDFHAASLQEIFRVLEDNYGYRLQIEGSVDMEKQFTGKVPADKVNILLEGLGKTHKLDINRQDQLITVRNESDEDT